MKILALDLGKFNSTCCFFDTKTRKAVLDCDAEVAFDIHYDFDSVKSRAFRK